MATRQMEAPEESPAAPLDSVGWRIVGGLVVGGWDVRLADLKMFRKLEVYGDVNVCGKIF